MKNLKLALLAFGLGVVHAQGVGQQTVGLFTYDQGTTDAYLLLAPNASTQTYLVDNCGRSVHEWTSQFQPGNAVYLLPDGQLLRTRRVANPNFPVGGSGGGVEILDWNGNVTWSHTISNGTEQQHHDAIQLPNGNIIMLLWHKYTNAEAIDAGRNPSGVTNGLWTEKLVEIQPSGISGGTVVWEWDLWHHLIQDLDSTKSNYGVVEDHPELMDLNFYNPNPGTIGLADWWHANAVAYNADLDQLVISSRNLGEFFVIDHSTTTAEAASHSGGNQGKGGDFLYRWGNPQTYRRGTPSDQQLFGQHNVHWIQSPSPDSGKIIVFNNGDTRPSGQYSSVEIIQTPVSPTGSYPITTGQAFAPAVPTYTWTHPNMMSFYSGFISGAEQLPNGNIVACAGNTGRVIEAQPNGTVVWEYVNPVQGTGPVTQGTTPANNSTFRGIRYPANYAGLVGQNLVVGDRLEGQPLPLPAQCLPSGLADEQRGIALAAYPNPGNTAVHVECSGTAEGMVDVYSLNGQLIHAEALANGKAQLSTAGFADGVYFIRLRGTAASIKWLKAGQF